MGGIAVTVPRSRIALVGAFVLVHAWLVAANLIVHPHDMYDVTTVYRGWMVHGIATGQWVGLQLPWVYPTAALLPMALAAAGGVAHYGEKWLIIVCLLDLVALLVLVGRRGRSAAAGWLWTAFLLVLGPIALARIDSITVPLAVIAVAVIARRPVVAGVLLGLAVWIKVWPVALLLTAVVAVRSRVRVVIGAVATSVVVVVVVVVFGSVSVVAGFLTAQTDRGLQIEAPVSGIWVWDAILEPARSHIFFARSLVTWQVIGPGATVASALMTPLLAVAVVAVVLLGIRARRRAAGDGAIVPALAFAVVSALIVFNKVGSPQYIGWLVLPVVLTAVMARPLSLLLRTMIALALVIAGLTQLVFPWFYPSILKLHPTMVVVLTARNGLLVALFVVAVVALARVRRSEVVAVASAPRLNA